MQTLRSRSFTTSAFGLIIGSASSCANEGHFSDIVRNRIATILLLWVCIASVTSCTHSLELQERLVTQQSSTEMPSNCIPREALDEYLHLSWQRRVDVWKTIPAKKNGVVFVGSSIVEEGPWTLLFPGETIINRGISGDTTSGVLDRLDEIIALEPEKVFLYIGGNDLSRLSSTPEHAFTRLSQSAKSLKVATPETEIFVHTLFAVIKADTG